MNRYLIVGCLLILPLYGIRKVTEEIVHGMASSKKASQMAKKLKQQILTDLTTQPVLDLSGSQLIAREKNN